MIKQQWRKMLKGMGIIEKQGTWKRKDRVFYRRKQVNCHKACRMDAVPLCQDHWACLEHPESFVISVQDQPFPSPTINLLTLF